MPKIINLIQGSPEWHEWRKGKIGASDAAAIMGVSPWETPLQCWERMVFGTQKPKSFSMERGTRLESKARDIFNEKNNLNMQPTCIESDIYPWMIASLDGYIPSLALEIKCPGEEAHLIALYGHVPSYYYPQLQHQMAVSDLSEIIYFSFDGEEGISIRVPRDESYISSLIAKEQAFFDSLSTFDPPEASDRDLIEIFDPRASEAAESFQKIAKQIQYLQKEADRLKSELIIYSGHNRAKIGNLKLTKVIRKGNISYGDIPELKGVDLEPYRKSPIESWRITI